MKFADIYASDFIDAKNIKWTIDMWSWDGSDSVILQINNTDMVFNLITIEFHNLSELILIINSYSQLPQELKIRCIKVYKNRVFS